MTWSLLIKKGWLSCKPQRTVCLCYHSQHWGCKCTPSCQDFCGVLKIQFWSSCLHSQHLTERAVFLASINVCLLRKIFSLCVVLNTLAISLQTGFPHGSSLTSTVGITGLYGGTIVPISLINATGICVYFVHALIYYLNTF